MKPPLQWFLAAAALAAAPAATGAADAPPTPETSAAKPASTPSAAAAKPAAAAASKPARGERGGVGAGRVLIHAESYGGNFLTGTATAYNAEVDYADGTVRITAPEMSFVRNADGQRFVTKGGTVFDAENLRLLARDISIEFPNETPRATPSPFTLPANSAAAAAPTAPNGATASAGTHRFGFPPLFVQGGEARIHQTPPFAKTNSANTTAAAAASASTSTSAAAAPSSSSNSAANSASAAASAATDITVSEATLRNVVLYYQEPDFWSISVTAARITLASETPAGSPAKEQRHASAYLPDATLHVEDAFVRVAGVPIFYLPSYTQHGLELPPLRPVVRAGQKDNIGVYLRTTTYYTGLGNGLQPGLLLDGYQKAGVLVGPALQYDTTARRLPDSATFLRQLPMHGSLLGGWIDDSSHRGTDNYDERIGRQRGFLLWDHKQTLALDGAAAAASPAAAVIAPPRHRLELTASVNYWSDTSVLRDYRPDQFNRNQRPDSFLEIVHPAPDHSYYLTAFARFRPNSYENVHQRLPELRFDMPTRPLARTGLNHHLNAAFTYLYERTSPEYPFGLPVEIPDPLPGDPDHTQTIPTNTPNGTVTPGGKIRGTLESPRLDLYYGLDYPLKLGDWLSLTPVAGVRATTYLDPVETAGANQSDPYTRVLPQLGFDLHLLGSGRWEYRNETWGINGLRHRLRPLAQYRWVPRADKGADRIPAIDRSSFLPLPSPVDIEQRRDSDDLRERQILRLGLENVLETRHETYGSRNLAWVNFYQDFRDTTRDGDRARSVFYTQAGLSPAYWLEINLLSRLDTYTLNSREISAQLDLRDGDRWHLWFGAQYITDVAETNQYYWGLEYRLNSNYTLRGFWRFDSATSRVTEQYYGLSQRLGSTWTVEYHLAHRRDARRDNGFSVGATVHLARY